MPLEGSGGADKVCLGRGKLLSERLYGSQQRCGLLLGLLVQGRLRLRFGNSN